MSANILLRKYTCIIGVMMKMTIRIRKYTEVSDGFGASYTFVSQSVLTVSGTNNFDIVSE
jgi:hypothetical protein